MTRISKQYMVSRQQKHFDEALKVNKTYLPAKAISLCDQINSAVVGHAAL